MAPLFAHETFERENGQRYMQPGPPLLAIVGSVGLCLHQGILYVRHMCPFKVGPPTSKPTFSRPNRRRWVNKRGLFVAR